MNGERNSQPPVQGGEFFHPWRRIAEVGQAIVGVTKVAVMTFPELFNPETRVIFTRDHNPDQRN